MTLLNEARSKHAERIWNEYLENYFKPIEIEQKITTW